MNTGRVVASHGRHVVVETPSSQRLICHPRGKKSTAVVGDTVLWLPSGDEGRIEQIEPRRNLFYRQDEVRTKSFAANLDQLLILMAAEPEFSESQLARSLIAAEAERIPVLLALNKSDLRDAFERGWQRLRPYQRMGYPVIALSLRMEVSPELAARLEAKTTLVLGPSGVGKSTLINQLVPNAPAQTQEISSALNTGRHTTTSTTWYWTDAARRTAVIDSPGFQEFGLRHIDPMHLAALMPDLRGRAGSCRFYNCTHLHEPGCSVISAVNSQENPESISISRYQIYSDLFSELSQNRY